MENNEHDVKRRKAWATVVAVVSAAIVIFVCLFSLFHLPERDPVETPVMAEDPNYVAPPVEGIEETNDIMSASRQEVAGMLGDLEMQYQNAALNGEPYAAEQAGLRLALAYRQAGEPVKAKDFLNALKQNYSYDTTFVAKCNDLLTTLNH